MNLVWKKLKGVCGKGRVGVVLKLLLVSGFQVFLEM